MQAPLQSVYPSPQTSVQTPSSHDSPVEHLWRQAPQLLTSDLISVSLPKHVMTSDATHSPDAQICPSPQTLPQAPQLAASLVKLIHLPLQSVVSAGQTQAPSTQFWPSTQASPQAPQLALSDERSVQTPQQSVFGVASGSSPSALQSTSDGVQTPSAHVSVVAHFVSQLPQ